MLVLQISSFTDRHELANFSMKNYIGSKTLTKNQVAQRWYGVAAIFILLTLLFFWNPVQFSLTNCRFHEITGISCPTCGLSRSLHAVAHFQFWDAIQFHLMGPIIFLIIMVLFIKLLVEAVSGERYQKISLSDKSKPLLIIFFSTWFVFALIRFLWELSLKI